MTRRLLPLTAVAVTALWSLGPTDTVVGGSDDAPAPAVVIKRRSETTSEDLRKQLMFVAEAGFNQNAASLLYAPIKKAGAKITSLTPDLGPRFFASIAVQTRQTEQFALPWRSGPDCEMGKEEAERLHVLSTHLRDYLRKSTPAGDVRPDAAKLRDLIRTGTDAAKAEEWTRPEALPTLMQLLQAENTPVRSLLIELLGNIKGKQASLALVQRAVFDLSPEVREKAVQTLATRPPAEYQRAFVIALRYPWPAAADHAAEAIAALKLTALVPDLVPLLKEPDPTLPVKVEKGYAVREIVRVNHLCNCMLCHAPSLAKDDLIRGRVPMPGEDPPPLYYAATTGIFVRADITYLRQDFSVVQPVSNAGKWPGNQRYDYVLRVRKLTPAQAKVYQRLEKKNELPKTYSQREAVLFALRQVTMTDAGDTYEQWSSALPKLRKVIQETERSR